MTRTAPRSSKCWIGFDLGGTKMFCAAFDTEMRMRASLRQSTAAEDGDEGLTQIETMIRRVMREAGLARRDVGGIGIGTPGPLDLERGVLLAAPNLGWRNVPLRRRLEAAFGCPVVVANDVDAGTYGEYVAGAAQGARTVLGIFPGTGIGGACVYEGRLLRGRRRSCMEIGHMKLLPRGPLCGCGRRGCLEAMASRIAIAAAAAAAALRGEAPALRKLAGTDLARIRSRALAESIRRGDATVERIVRRAARHIGLAAANAINLLAPDVVVLGGGLVEAMPKLFVEEVLETAQDEVMDAFRGTFRVVAARLGDQAAVVGAAALAMQEAARA
ncbi:MAG: ROK family protein [Kiritimatiellae bacterium]|nr:ROK family protein [Kiritimatiellia bacterium]